MAWGYIASSAVSGNAHSVNTKTVTLGAAVSVGDRIIVNVTYVRDGSTAPTGLACSDSLSNTYNLDVQAANQVQGAFTTITCVWSAPVTTGGTPNVTCSQTGTASVNWEVDITAEGFSGLNTAANAVDKSTSTVNSGSSTTPDSGSVAATTAANELVIGAIEGDNGAATTLTAGSGYTIRTNGYLHTGTETDHGTEDKDSGSSGATPKADGTFSTSQPWAAICVVYQLASGGGGSGLPFFMQEQNLMVGGVTAKSGNFQ